jgi:uncharacterized repeat protein (TIGR03803 family)
LRGDLTTLYSFRGPDGAGPTGGLLEGTNSNLYGTTFTGGTYGFGTVFELAPNSGLTTLHNFDVTDGDEATASLIQATDGNLYGTTSGGGEGTNCHCGTLFSITTGGTLVTLHSFNFTDGEGPEGSLLQATNGQFYGTTLMGCLPNCDSPYGCGTVFSLDMGLQPFVSFIEGSGRVGETGGILGQGLSDTTSVSLNGTPAKFKVTSSTYIQATVPSGATTGYVTVTVPGGTLTSNVPFHVIR